MIASSAARTARPVTRASITRAPAEPGVSGGMCTWPALSSHTVTVLPALLQLLGPRVDRGRIPFLPQLATAGESRFWAGVVDRVMRRPVLAACLSGGLLVALAAGAVAPKSVRNQRSHVVSMPSAATPERKKRAPSATRALFEPRRTRFAR